MKKIQILLSSFIVIFIFSSIRSQDLTLSNRYFTASSFITSVASQKENAKRNIALACEKLNNITIHPGTVFSFNSIVGEGSSKNGYVSARVLYRDRIRMEPGGGLCQMSSTVFNALLLAGCRIIERHRHYQPVSYVPLGLDATIKYGKKNLRMKNPYKYKLIMNTSMNDKSLLVNIKSESPLLYKYDVNTEEEEISLPFLKDKEDIRNGVSVYVYRLKYKGKRLLNKLLLYKDYYPPVYNR